MRVDTDTRKQIDSHYRSHAETYDRIWSKLDAIQERFREADRDGKIAHLKLSYINSVISIRTTADKQDEAIARLMAGENLETAMASVNYRKQKQKYMEQSLSENEVWTDLASALEAENTDIAHKTALDQLKYIGTVKAPFLLAMLGYTEKMCLDGNAISVIGMDDYPSTSDVQQYEELCRKLRSEFPTLSEEIDPFHLHWVIFDWQRSSIRNADATSQQLDRPVQVTHHDPWFDAALSELSKIESIVETVP